VIGAAGQGLSAQGTLTNASCGVIGMQGLSLNSVSAATAQGSMISSASRTVKLESGTQMLLQLEALRNKTLTISCGPGALARPHFFVDSVQ
jgi:hypothetical protein